MPQMRPFSQFCNAETPLVQAKQLFFHRENPTGKNVDIVSFWCIDRGRVHFSSGSWSVCRPFSALPKLCFLPCSLKHKSNFLSRFCRTLLRRRRSSPGRGTESLRRKRTARNPSHFLGNRNAKARKRPPGFPSGGMRRRSPFMRGEPGQAMQSADVSQPLPSRRGDLLFKLSQKATGEVSPFMKGKGR